MSHTLSSNASGQVPNSLNDTAFLGHPKGLGTLFFTELWERFSYYGMRALLILFMTAAIENGGLGYDTQKASAIYGLYTAMVYMVGLPGGWIADKLIGQRKAVLFGGIIIALGHISMAFHGESAFFLGLVLIIAGTGLLKPNISSMVGGLYSEEDSRRDAGFSIYYMGINLGAMIAPLACGFLAQSESFKGILLNSGFTPQNSWHWGFGAAAVGMILGIIQYIFGAKNLGTVGLAPEYGNNKELYESDRRTFITSSLSFMAICLIALALHFSGTLLISISLLKTIAAGILLLLPILYFTYTFLSNSLDLKEKKRIAVIGILYLFAILFWAAFEQAGSSLSLFADKFTRNEIFGFSFPSSWFQSVNAFFIIALAPAFSFLWLALGKNEPSSPGKFSYALLFVGLGFLLISIAAVISGPNGDKVSPMWLISLFLVHTIGELCLSPVGLSMVTKLAPPKIVSQLMGIWFLSTATGNFVAGQVAGFFDLLPLPQLFGSLFMVTFIASIVLALLAKKIKTLMGGVN